MKTDPKRSGQWPKLTNLKQLQCFLGFANFYHCFIRNYSQVAAPLSCLSTSSTPFVWTPEADNAFAKLKELSPSAPVLIQPSQQLIVEVDASDSGVVLSQHCMCPGPGLFKNASSFKLPGCALDIKDASDAKLVVKKMLKRCQASIICYCFAVMTSGISGFGSLTSASDASFIENTSG